MGEWVDMWIPLVKKPTVFNADKTQVRLPATRSGKAGEKRNASLAHPGAQTPTTLATCVEEVGGRGGGLIHSGPIIVTDLKGVNGFLATKKRQAHQKNDGPARCERFAWGV